MNKLLSFVSIPSAMVLALATGLSAQGSPFAPGPQHPMTAPLPVNHPDAILPAELQNVPAQPEQFTPSDILNQLAPLPTDANVIEHSPIHGTTVTIPTSALGLAVGGDANLHGRHRDRSEPFAGSVPLIDAEPEEDGIIGADTRTTIWNASSYPYRPNAKMYMTFPNGNTFVGSCTLVNRKYAITCGHCIFDASQGGWATQVRVIPGLSGSYQPYGSAWVSYMRTYTGWTVSGRPDHDIALITLDRNIGSTTGWFGYGNWSNLNGVTMNLLAYDADINSTRQKYRYSSIVPYSLFIYHYGDSAPGSSGGGMYRILSGGRYVMGAHGWGWTTINGGARITSSRFSNIQSWINTGY